MQTYTLYQAERFFIFIISLYGFNESNAKFKVYNRSVRAVAFLCALFCLLHVFVFGHLITVGDVPSGTPRVFVFEKLYLGSNLACIILCLFRKRKFDALLEVLKRYRVSQKLCPKIRNWNIFLAFIAAPIYVIWQGWPAVNEKMEEIKKSKSALRRARLTTRLILLSTSLSSLVKATDDYGAPLMFILKATGNILNVILIYECLSTLTINSLGKQVAVLASDVPPLLFFLSYLCYLRVAPSANQIPFLIARVMMKNVMGDEQVMSREPISRIQLLKTRVVQLAHLTHSNFNRGQLTVLGAPVDEADIFMVFVEIIDNYNTYISALW